MVHGPTAVRWTWPWSVTVQLPLAAKLSGRLQVVRAPTVKSPSTPQILVVTSGSGMVATEHEQLEINVGDVVHIKAGERHWHGAKADTTMGHITITAVGGQAAWG